MKYRFVFCSLMLLSFMHLNAQSGDPESYRKQKIASKNYNNGISRVLEGNYDAALASFDSAIVLNPIFAKAYNERGKIYYTKNQYTEAILEFEKASDLDSSFGEAFFNLAFTGFVQHIELIRSDTLIVGSKDFSKAIAKGYKTPQAYYYRGLMRLLEGETDSASADFTRAVELKLNYSKAYHDRGTAKNRLGDFQGAIYDYRLAATYQAGLVQALVNMGNSKKLIGDYQGAERDYTQALILDSVNFIALNNRGSVRYVMSDYDGAASDFQAAYILSPGSPGIASNMGSIEHERGNYESAIQWFNEALEINNKYAPAIVNRGLSYEMTGKLKEACADWRHASELGLSQADVYLKECKE